MNGKLALVEMLRPSQHQAETGHRELLASGTLNSSGSVGGEHGRMIEQFARSSFVLRDSSAWLFSKENVAAYDIICSS